jgi:hypothetical protein
LRWAFVNAGHSAEIFVAGSEIEHRDLCESNGCQWVEHENEPVGAKWNAVARRALDWAADYIFILGSDDFFSDSLIAEYVDLPRQRVVHAGLRGVYIYEPESDRLLSLMANQGRFCTKPGDSDLRVAKKGSKPAVGTGRLVHRSCFDWHETYWEPHKNRALDASLQKTLRLPPARLISLSEGRLAVDVKTGTNIWSFDSLAEVYSGCLLESSDILHSLPEWEAIRSLAVPQPGR